MGYSVLYIAFGIVALWLLGEVLLQYKARLRWRALAFAGFLGVAGGVAMREIVVIVLGAIAFGVGQSYVTLSYKRGFAAGWALDLGGGRGRPRVRSPHSDPVLEVSAVEEDDAGGAAGPDAGDRIADPGTVREDAAREDVYQPMPMHDDSGEYPQYRGGAYGAGPAPAADPYAGGGYGGYGGGWDTGAQPAAASYGFEAGQDPYAPGHGWSADQQPAAASYDYDPAGYQQQPSAGYGTGGYDTGSYGTGGYDTGSYGTGGYSTGDWTPPQGTDPYGYGYGYPQDPPQPSQAQQPYMPQQQPYEAPAAPYPPQGPSGGQAQQPTDPYDPYRY